MDLYLYSPFVACTGITIFNLGLHYRKGLWIWEIDFALPGETLYTPWTLLFASKFQVFFLVQFFEYLKRNIFKPFLIFDGVLFRPLPLIFLLFCPPDLFYHFDYWIPFFLSWFWCSFLFSVSWIRFLVLPFPNVSFRLSVLCPVGWLRACSEHLRCQSSDTIRFLLRTADFAATAIKYLLVLLKRICTGWRLLVVQTILTAPIFPCYRLKTCVSPVLVM